MQNKSKTKLSFIVVLWRLLERRHRLRMAVIGGSILLSAAFEALSVGLLFPYIALVVDSGNAIIGNMSKQLIDATKKLSTQNHMIILTIFLMVVFFIKAIFIGMCNWWQSSYAREISASLSQRLMMSLVNRPYELHLSRDIGKIARILVDDVHSIGSALVVNLLTVATEIPVALLIICVLAWVDPFVTLGTFLIFGLTIGAVLGVLRPITNRYSAIQMDSRAKVLKAQQECLSAVKVVKTLGVGSFFANRYSHAAERYYHTIACRQTVLQLPRLALETIATLAVLGLILWVQASGMDKTQGFAVLMTFAAAAFRLLPSANRVLNAITQIRFSLHSLDAVAEEIAVQSEAGGADAPFTFGNAIEFHGVSYTYPGASIPSLRELSIIIPHGQAIGVVGRSGAGKSTLVDLLLGLLSPTQGTITVDGRPIVEDPHAWRNSIGYVPQQIILLDDTVRRNVAFGLPDSKIDDNRVWEALSRACLTDAIKVLPEGLDATVGEGGLRFSGGQRQRIAIARALYHRPLLVIFDEATSALDAETSAALVEEIEALRGAVTLVVITHQSGIFQQWDHVIRLEQGCLAEE